MGFGYNDFDTGFGMEFQLFNVMFFLIFFSDSWNVPFYDSKRIKHLE